MCECNNIEIGSYQNTIPIWNPFSKKIVGIDKCILNEISLLWKCGIETIESCCGHNKHLGYIAVKEEYILEMLQLGYKTDNETDSPGCFLTLDK